MKNIYILFIMFLSALNSFAQPGYLGKRMSLSYNLNTSLIVNGINYQGENKYFRDFNLINSLRMDYVTNRKSSKGIQFGYFRTGLYPVNFSNSDAYENYQYGNPFKLHSFMYAVNFRSYYETDGNIAPFGGYVELTIGAQHQHIYDALVDDYLGAKFVPFLSLTFGTQRVHFDKLLMDYSFRISLYPQSLTIIANDYNSNGIDELSFKDRLDLLQNNAIIRTQMLDMFTFKIGFGTLVK